MDSAWWGVGWGVVGSIIGAVAIVPFQHLVEYLRTRRGALTGSWIQQIPAQKGQPAKSDQVQCRNIGSRFAGEIRRMEPRDQDHKRWRFSGQVRGSLVFMTFWTTDLAKNPGSYGTIQLNMINDAHLKGFYIKRIVTPDRQQFTERFEQLEVEWVRPEGRLA